MTSDTGRPHSSWRCCSVESSRKFLLGWDRSRYVGNVWCLMLSQTSLPTKATKGTSLVCSRKGGKTAYSPFRVMKGLKTCCSKNITCILLKWCNLHNLLTDFPYHIHTKQCYPTQYSSVSTHLTLTPRIKYHFNNHLSNKHCSSALKNSLTSSWALLFALVQFFDFNKNGAT